MNALAPEHIDDLRRSGLSDDTIEALLVAAVPPHELKHLTNVISACAFPYFNMDGSVNCFKRWKLFPSITTADGHAQKYYQPAGTSTHVYLPPLLSWTNTARHSNQPLVFTEGEKKAACACQHGLITAGIAGVWNWRQRLETGEPFLIPTLDQFVWKDRTVELIPDSDAWREERLITVLGGFYAFGQELLLRGANVRLVKLPERSAVKVGLDDWFVTTGTIWESEWPALERVALDDQRLGAVAAWWQRWREKQLVQESLRKSTTEPMDLKEVAGLYFVSFPAHHVEMTFHRLTESRGGVQAELTVKVGEVEVLGETDIGLKSDTARDKVAKTLKGLVAHVEWKRLLERACTSVLKGHRRGEPTIVLEPTASAIVPFILNPLVYRDHQSLIYAPGGSCKSYLALYFALLVCHGAQGAGIGGVKSNVLYLDWELNADTVGGRLKALQGGHPELSHHRPFYRRCEVPLHQEVHTIAATVAERKVKLVIIDSAALACGGELSSPDAAIGLQQALRRIGCASLVLAHVAKHTQEGQEKSAYGTVFFRELARNVWELTRAADSNPVHVALSHTKDNFSQKREPIGFALHFTPEAVRIEAGDVNAEPEFQDKLPIHSRIRNLLDSDGVPHSSQYIADALHLKLETVQATLSRYKGKKWHMIGENREAQWTTLNS